MIGGQVLDLAAEKTEPNEQEIRTLQAMKTGALISYACIAGAMLGEASNEDTSHLARYGETIGLAFQLADDLLDVTSDRDTMGKAVGKDSARGKGTLVSLLGIARVHDLLDETVKEADRALSAFGDKADTLRQTARFIVARRS